MDGPISAVVLELEAPLRLVMGWQSPYAQTAMTWVLQPWRGGSRLRVTETGYAGADREQREAALRRLFAALREFAAQIATDRPARPVGGRGPGSSRVDDPDRRADRPGTGFVGPRVDGAAASRVDGARSVGSGGSPGSAPSAAGPLSRMDGAAGAVASSVAAGPPPSPSPVTGAPHREPSGPCRAELVGLVAMAVPAGLAWWLVRPDGSAGGPGTLLPGEGSLGRGTGHAPAR